MERKDYEMCVFSFDRKGTRVHGFKSARIGDLIKMIGNEHQNGYRVLLCQASAWEKAVMYEGITGKRSHIEMFKDKGIEA